MFPPKLITSLHANYPHFSSHSNFRKSEAIPSHALISHAQKQQQQIESNKIFNHHEPHMPLSTKLLNLILSHAFETSTIEPDVSHHQSHDPAN
jgi:hypothetical protein